MGAIFNKPITETKPTEIESKTSPHNFYDEFIHNLVKSHKIVVFSKTNCSFCTKAKDVLKEKNLEYHSIELDVNKQCPNDNCQQLTTSLILQTRMRTVPQIFINGKLIGGFTDLESMARDDLKFKEFLTKS